MITVTAEEKALCRQRPTAVDHARTQDLQLLGSYQRRLPIPMVRMMENALDWEHLPHIHASSFSDISGISHGNWGWRAKASQTPPGEEDQLIELLLDSEQNYWATSVVSGPGQGIEIHTQATPLSEAEIEIEIRFYSSNKVPEEHVGLYADLLTQQYALLYDEDVVLMTGRQAALDNRQAWSQRKREKNKLLVGDIKDLEASGRTIVEASTGRFCVRKHRGEWIAHSAVCSHLLGPLDDAVVDTDGSISCPWHGYRFKIDTGENLDGKCRALESPPLVKREQDKLYLYFQD